MLIKDRKTVLFDTGIGPERLEKLKNRVDVVINSHLHPDHIGSNWIFSKRTILISDMEFHQCDLEVLARRYIGKELQKKWIEFVKETTGYRDFQPAESFSDGETLKFGETEVVPLHLPGHTSAHYGFYLPDHDLVFGADIDLTSFGPWYGHEESSLREFRQSIDRLMKLNLKFYLSGHRDPVQGEERISGELEKYRDIIDERTSRILSPQNTEEY